MPPGSNCVNLPLSNIICIRVPDAGLQRSCHITFIDYSKRRARRHFAHPSMLDTPFFFILLLTSHSIRAAEIRDTVHGMSIENAFDVRTIPE